MNAPPPSPALLWPPAAAIDAVLGMLSVVRKARLYAPSPPDMDGMVLKLRMGLLLPPGLLLCRLHVVRCAS